MWTLPTSGAPFCGEDETQDVLEEPIPVTSIRGGDLSLLHLGGGLLHLLHHLLDGGLSLDGLGSLGRCWLLENSLLDLDGLGGTGLLHLHGQHLRLVGGNHGVAVLLGAVGRVHWGGVVALDAPVVNMGNSSMVDHRSVVDDRGMVDNGSSVVDNGGSVVDDRGGVVDNRGMVDKRSVESWGNGGGSHDRGNPDNRGGGSNRSDLDDRGRGRGGDNRSSSNLDKRGSLHCRLRREDGFALVGDGSVVALRSCGVCDDLNSAVGKVDSVLSSGVGTVTLLGLGEHRVAEALVVHSVLVL